MYNKRAISPVIATALLFVVAVVAVVGFQGWFTTFSSNLFTKTETQSSSSIGNTQIESVQGYNLYFKNGNTENISVNKIKVGDSDCNVSGNYSSGISEIDLGSCLNNLTSKTQDVVVYTNNGIYSEKVYLKDIVIRTYSSCTLDGATVAHLGSYLFYNTSTVPFGGNCSLNSLTRNCFDGTYSGNSSYQYASCSVVGQDITPNAFNFTNQTGVNLSTIITSNTLTPTGYEGSVSVGVTGDGNPQLSVAGGSWTTSSTISVGQNITLRLNSSSQYVNISIVTLSIGNYSVNFSVQTKDSIYIIATGGNITYDGNYKIHTFLQNSSFVINYLGTDSTYGNKIDYLIVGGGGAGGQVYHGGGGGAGGVIYNTSQNVTLQSYAVMVGLGGLSSGVDGQNSTFFGKTAIGGGGGGSQSGHNVGNIGASGGGACGNCGGNAFVVANGTIGQGNNGGTGGNTGTTAGYGAGGGGGAGAVGGNNGGGAGGGGGIGVQINITGTSIYYAGGGGGSTYASGCNYGPSGNNQGGGGNGGSAGGINGINGTGGGGGGSERCGGGEQGLGGSGVVIIRYRYQ